MNLPAKKLLTLDEWLAVHEDSEERAELINGEVSYKFAPSVDHSNALMAMCTEFSGLQKRGPGGWWIIPEVLVLYEGRANGFIHDIAGWRKENHPKKPRGKSVSARPDWVCEILSSNRSNDLVTKRWVLHEHRVPYYWIVDIKNGLISVMEWGINGYTIIADAKAGEKIILSPFDVEMDISVLLDLEDR
jgi:Uma2 family endonuclease